MHDIDTNKKLTVRFKGDISIENKKWNVGVIFGASGTGKSQIAKTVFPDNYVLSYEYDHKKSILDNFAQSCSIEQIVRVLTQVGFSSPVSWLKPYHVLSEGEKMRVNLASALLDEDNLIVFDEYTSVVNREVAKIGSFAVQKAVRRTNKQFVAVTCHEDVIEWLEPDWVFNTNLMKFFFVTENTEDHQLNLRSVEEVKVTGDCLVSITI